MISRWRISSGSKRLGGNGLAGFEAAHALCERLLERAADGHHLADRLHLRSEHRLGAGEFFELPARNLHHHVVERRLKAGRRLARDVVLDFVQPIADGELGGDLGDRESGGLGRQRGAARDARIHLHDHHAPVFRIDGELHVRSAGVDADLAQAAQRAVAHHLVLAIGERLRRRHGDGIARVHAHRIEVLDGADDDGVVGQIAHHLQLEFLPAEDALFDQDFVHRRKIEAALQNLGEILAIVGDAAAGAAQREAGPQNHRIADAIGERQPVFDVVHQLRLRRLEADLAHRILEQQAVFGLLDGFDLGADQLDAVLVEHAGFGQIDREIETGLAADGGEQRIRDARVRITSSANATLSGST